MSEGTETERERVKELVSAVGPVAAKRLIELFCQGITKGHGSMRAAVEEMDREQIEAEAHRVKGVSIQMGAGALSEMCRFIEKGAHTRSQEEFVAKLAEMESEMLRVTALLKQIGSEIP